MRIAICILAAGIFAQDPVPGKPNVLFIVTDDQRPDTIAALGNPAIKTPNLDRLVEGGFVFRNAYCMGSTVGAVCMPSRHMFLSGMSLFRYDPKKAENTFGDAMRRAGYETWHLSKRGNEAPAYHAAFEHTAYLKENEDRISGHHGRSGADRAIEFLRRRNAARPFFMYLGLEGPHDPRVAAEEWMLLYERDKISLPANYAPFHPIDNGDLLVRDEKLAPWPRTEDVVRKHLHDYYACISSIDHQVGRILKALQDLGAAKKTIVVFTSDHGLAVGSHGLFGKQNLYEHSMGVPLVFSGPGVPKGRSEAFAYLFDIFPTVCELSGFAPPKELDGRSFAPVLRGEKPAVRETVFLAYRNLMRAVRRGDWKLLRYPQVGHTQLFNLKDDPHETKNLAGDPRQADRVKELLALLEEEQKRTNDKAPLTVPDPRPAAVDLDFFKK